MKHTRQKDGKLYNHCWTLGSTGGLQMLSRTLLAHVAPMLTIQFENLATGALCYLLNRYEPAAKAFIRLARQAAPYLPERLEFRTQVRWEAGVIPDMVGLHNNVQVLHIESKFWAQLTRNQPVSYINLLPESPGGLLLFICPAKRTLHLWDEITGCCSSAGMAVGPTTLLAPGFQATSVGRQRQLALVTWEMLLSKLEFAIARTDQAAGIADLDQLRGLCERIEHEELKPVSLHDPVASGDHYMEDLNRFADDIVDGLVAGGHAQIGGYRATPGAGYYKRYMMFHGLRDWCVEWNLDYPKRFEHTSLWLTTTVTRPLKHRLTQFASLLSIPCHFVDNQLLIPLSGSEGLGRTELLRDVIQKIEQVGLLLEKTAAGEGSPLRPTTRRS